MKKALIVLMALALLSAFALPAAAAEKSEVSFGGYVAFETWVVDEDEAMLDLDNDGSWDDGRYDDTDTHWQLDTVASRFNATFTRENFTGYVEIRPRNGSYFRHWWAEWNFGPGYLLIGQAGRPIDNAISSTCAGDEIDLGSVYGGDTTCDTTRLGQIRLRFPFSVGQFQFAFLDPAGADVDDERAALGSTEDDTDTTLPMVEADLDLSFGPVSFSLYGGWHEYEEVYRNQNGDNEPDETEFDIESWIVGANGTFTTGPFRVAVGGWMGENTAAGLAVLGAHDRGILQPVIFDGGDGDNWFDGVHDTDDWGVCIDLSFKLNDMVSFAAGGGTIEQDRSDDQIGANNGDELENECTRWFVNSTITVAEGFTITPEIGEFDHETSITDGGEPLDQGDEFYYGIWWKMVF
jgi:hypothetical protein